MCTLTWQVAAGRAVVLFNRDEAWSRSAEGPVGPGESGGVRLLAPRDGERGGTWAGVNEYGLVLALLNDYRTTWRPAAAPPISRGWVVHAGLASTHLADVERNLRELPLTCIPAFRLFALLPFEGGQVWHWDGHSLQTSSAKLPSGLLTSSSFRSEEIEAARLAAWEQLASRHVPEVHLGFHQRHDPDHPEASVLMRRADAGTRSLLELRVEADAVTARHTAIRWSPTQAPILAPPLAASLPRRAPAPPPAAPWPGSEGTL
jgi:hypothetical protein